MGGETGQLDKACRERPVLHVLYRKSINFVSYADK